MTDSAGRKFVVKILPLQVPFSFFPHRAVSALAGAFGLLWVSCATAPRAAAPSPPPAAASPAPVAKAGSSILEVGVPVERTLNPGQPDEVPLELKADHYGLLSFDSKSLSLSVVLFAPGGAPILRQEGGSEGRLAWITSTPGVYRLVVSPLEAKVTGRYQILLRELRPRIPTDDRRVEADAALAAAKREKDPSKAVEWAQKARSLWSDLKDVDGEFEALRALWDLDGKNAVSWYEKALAYATVTGDRRQLAEVQTHYGSWLTFHRKPEQAAPLLENALQIWRGREDSYQESWVLYYLGIGSDQRGRPREAIDFYEQALKKADPGWFHTPDAWNGLCNVYTSLGESQKALVCFDHAFRLVQDHGRKGAEAAVRTGRGVLYLRRGEFQKALTDLQEAERINRSDPELDKDYTRRVLVHLGFVYFNLGQPEEALREYQEALQTSRQAEDTSGIASALVQIGTVNLTAGRTGEALADFQKALDLASKAGDIKLQGLALHFIGVAQLELGQVSQAVDSLRQALPLREKADRFNAALTEQKLGQAYEAQGNLSGAETSLRHALQITEETGSSYFQASIYLDLAKLERKKENLHQALVWIEHAIQILESVRYDIPDDRLRTSFLASRRQYYDFYVDLLMDLDGKEPGENYSGHALATSEMGRARALLDLLNRARFELTRGISPDLLARERDVRARLSQIQDKLEEERSRKSTRPLFIQELEARRQETEKEQQEIEQRIKNEYPLYAQLRYPSPLKGQEIQRLLQPDEALLEYSFGKEKAYLFVVTPEGISSHTLKRSPAEIGEDVETLRASLEKGALPTHAARQASRRLYETLITPASRAGLLGKRRLLIAPDGALHHLAFEALIDPTRGGAEGRFLIEDWAVSYIPSASVLSTLSEPRPEPEGMPSKQFIAFAPAYGKSALQEQAGNAALEIPRAGAGSAALPKLEGAQEEVAAISRLYQTTDQKVYVGPEASCKAFKGIGARTRALHYAGHGTLDEEHPERSSLEFTDGELRVDDIFNLELNADLVVLSACSTAGKVVMGEGLVGLTRAFLYAGAPSVVVTLWQAVDTTTRDLMVEFYENLGRTGDKAEALRQAKLSLIRQGRKPYYWAPFILVGKSR